MVACHGSLIYTDASIAQLFVTEKGDLADPGTVVQQSGQIGWDDTELSSADFARLNPRGNVPLVFLVNPRREVLFVSEGFSPKLTEEVLATLKAKHSNKLHR